MVAAADGAAGLNAEAAMYAVTRRYYRALDTSPTAELQPFGQWRDVVAHAMAAIETRLADEARKHAMWSWIAERVTADPVIVARLLARLDPARADTASSFWKYCGLSTVAGVAVKCNRCGRVTHQPRGIPATCLRKMGTPSRRCGGTLREDSRAAPVRIAQRWSKGCSGRRVMYDEEARTTAYLLGRDLIERSTAYSEFYRRELDRLSIERSTWAQLHRVRVARRRTTKAFLADLWVAWRLIEGLPVRGGSPRR